MKYMVDTVPGDSGVLAVSHVAVDRVPGLALVQIHHPSMEETTAIHWDRVQRVKVATPLIVHVRNIIVFFQWRGPNFIWILVSTKT